MLRKYIITFVILISILFSKNLIAQKITEFKHAQFVRNGNTYLKITPLTMQGSEPSDTEKYEVYGVLVCYSNKGKMKAKKLDITRGIIEKGEYEIWLGIGKPELFNVVSIEYFYIPENKGPSKDSCFE